MGRGPSLTSAERERIKSMRNAGDSLRTITKTLNRSYDTVHRVLEGPPLSKRVGAPRRLSDQQVQELVQVATAEKLSAKQLKSKLGYECSTRTIQRALIKHAGHKRRRDDDGSWSSGIENGDGRHHCDGEEANAEEQALSSQCTTVNSSALVIDVHNSTPVVDHASNESCSSSTSRLNVANASFTSSGSTHTSSMQHAEGGRSPPQVADTGVAFGVDTPFARTIAAISPTSTATDGSSYPRRVELAVVIQAQNELLDGVIAQLDRQTSTMEVLIRHLINQETQREPRRTEENTSTTLLTKEQ